MSAQPRLQKILEILMMLNCKYGRSIEELSANTNSSIRSVYRYIETIEDAGFVLEKTERGKRVNIEETQNKEIFDLLHFSEEEAHILSKAIHSIDDTNLIKSNLVKKLYSLYDFKRVANTIVKRQNSVNVHKLIDAIEQKKQVVLESYRSSNSDTVNNRLVEAFSFTQGYIAIWCYDIESKTNKTFKTARIKNVKILDTKWQFAGKHKKTPLDIFRIALTGKPETAKVKLSQRAKSLLIEEYPLAEKDIMQNKNNNYILETKISNYNGIGRFVIGLLDETEIISPIGFKLFVKQKIEENLKKKYTLSEDGKSID
ncbi:MAG: WYL domain-containing protein [Chlorobi bacterium]|nr:WYL domain-containing protein [Chlorobiota bacterium]